MQPAQFTIFGANGSEFNIVLATAFGVERAGNGLVNQWAVVGVHVLQHSTKSLSASFTNWGNNLIGYIITKAKNRTTQEYIRLITKMIVY